MSNRAIKLARLAPGSVTGVLAIASAAISAATLNNVNPAEGVAPTELYALKLPNVGRVAHSSRVLVAVSRRDRLPLVYPQILST